MKITLTGSLGNISKPLAQNLLNAGHDVTIISSNESKRPAIEALGANAAIGSVKDAAFLTSAFTGADIIYTMVPPDLRTDNFRKYANEVGNSFASAISAAKVTSVVNLSSIGAHLQNGTGPIAGIHDVEEILNALENVSVKHLRAAFFYVNFFNLIDLIKHANIIGANYSNLVMVHPEDIADAATEEIERGFTGTSVRYVASDERSGAEIAAVLGKAIGKPELPWIEFSDADNLNGLLQSGLPQEMSRLYVEMGQAVRSGDLWKDYKTNKPSQSGKTKLEAFAKEFAEAYEKR